MKARRLARTIAAVVLSANIVAGTSTPEAIGNVIAKALRPRPKMMPSEWGIKYRRMNDSPAGERFDVNFYPWIAPIIDAFLNEPHIEGWFFMKPAQVGGSQTVITLLLYLIEYAPGPILYVASTQDQAKTFAEAINFAIASSPHIAENFAVDGRSTQTIKPFAGGNWFFTGAGAESGVTSKPCRYVVIDEWDQCKDFPTMGSVAKVAEQRLGAYKNRKRTGFFGFAHPTTPDRGIHKVIETRADLREWMLRCPYLDCGKDFVPEWDQVKIIDRKPESAKHNCPHCNRSITDAQRWAATRAGRFVSVIDPDEAKRRRFVGFHVSRLCDPLTTLEELARSYVECVSESDLRVFHNQIMGRAYRDSSLVLTEEGIEAKAEAAERSGSRTVPQNTKLIVVGVDVQYPKDNPTMYVRFDGYTEDGNCFVIEYLKIDGWLALTRYLETLEATRPDGSKMRPKGCGIDSGFLTDQVYSFCRTRPGGIECVPMKFDKTADEDDPTVTKKIKDPTRPDLGAMLRLELCRGYWIDRQAKRWSPDRDPTHGGSIIAPASIATDHPTSIEFRNHIKANQRSEVTDENGHVKLIWWKDKGVRDDWFMAGVYGEVIAKGHGLDRWYLDAPTKPAERVSEVEKGLQREKTHRGRPGRSKFGKRRRRGRSGW